MLVLVSAMLLPVSVIAETSVCFGTTSNGSLENGVKLPSKGKNFTGYSIAARIAGRTYVHSEVRSIIIDAYRALEASNSGKIFKYAETGNRDGGLFKPHKTHQNGLSVDFMTPVVNENGKSVHLPTHAFNRLGYDIEFDSQNRYNGLKIDYESLAAHIVELNKQSTSRGHKLWRVIFAPELQAPLFETKHASYLRKYIQFASKRSWVRHDEHYHVDFDVKCEPR